MCARPCIDYRRQPSRKRFRPDEHIGGTDPSSFPFRPAPLTVVRPGPRLRDRDARSMDVLARVVRSVSGRRGASRSSRNRRGLESRRDLRVPPSPPHSAPACAAMRTLQVVRAAATRRDGLPARTNPCRRIVERPLLADRRQVTRARSSAFRKSGGASHASASATLVRTSSPTEISFFPDSIARAIRSAASAGRIPRA